ncbi:hypothetical protein ACROYT_G021098 [Oculina patagonica]
MVAGPETARLLEEFESQLKGDPGVDEKNEHHEKGLSTQKAFQSHVKNLVNTISEMGNPFQDDCPELLALDTRNSADASVVATVHTVQEIGLRQYEKYVKEVIKERTVSIHDTISKNSLPLFKCQQPKQISKASLKLTAVASDRYLFSRLYIASQQRDGDLEEFFKHENQPYPPSLSEFGNLRFGKKSDLITCVNRESPPAPASYDVKVFDGAAIVHALPVSSVSTFSQYADSTFLPFLENQLKSTKRIDVVWDEYCSASLKDATREKRGKGVRRKVAGHVKLPQNWQAFLEDSSNKKELFNFLTKQVETASFPDDKFVYITSGENVISSCPRQQMQSCNHEEADTRILVHVKDALAKGGRSVLVRTVDTDVVVILIAQDSLLNHSNRAIYQASIWTSLDEQQVVPSRQTLVGKWITTDGDPAGPYFQKPLKLVLNY